MGCLKIAGRHVGSTDGPSFDLPGCYESKSKRIRLGCDGPPPKPRTAADIEADSATASRILQACSGALDLDDFELVVDMLQDAKKLTGDEARAIIETMRKAEGRGEPEIAADSFYERYPDAARLKPSFDYSRPPPLTRSPVMSAAQEKAFYERYPDAARLK